MQRLSSTPYNQSRFSNNRPFTDLESVADYCKAREQHIENEIQNMHHHFVLEADKETHFTKFVNKYLSEDNTDYPKLNMDEPKRDVNSSVANIEVLYAIPWTGSKFAFSCKPTEDFGKPSDEVAIRVDDYEGKFITFYYFLPRYENEERFEAKLQKLLENDVSWVVDSLDNVIHHFQEHDKRILEIMARALDERIRTVVSLQGLVEDVEIPESIFVGRLSVDDAQVSSSKRSPRYNAFRPYLYGQQKGQCKGTGREIYFSQSSVDHVVPKSKGGKDELDNLAIMCQPCNKLKDDGTWEEYLEKIKVNPSICQGYKNTSESKAPEVRE